MSDLPWELFHRLILLSFDNPGAFSSAVDREVTRSRSLHSRIRRALTERLFDAIRWRRRIWGDIAPTHFDGDKVLAALEEAKSVQTRPPLAQWASLAPDVLAAQLSFPTWIIEEWLNAYGFESTISLALSLNQPAPTTLRVNTLKTNRETVMADLEKEGAATSVGEHSPWALHLHQRCNLGSFRTFKSGHFEIQDEGSQMAVQLSGARPGQTVVDACARTGGKALALAAMMQNKGKIIAADIDVRTLESLKKRAKRAGVGILETCWLAKDDPSPLPQLRNSADLVFVDAPCSGLGIVRRKPIAKWMVAPQISAERAETQVRLLQRFAAWLKPEGKLLYVVCTLLRRENADVVDRFLRERIDFTSLFSRSIRPDLQGTDGFFISACQKNLA